MPSFVTTIVELLKDPRTAIAGWIAMGVGPTLGFIFLILFLETGLVFTPFLPGDSLLFAAGYFAHDPNSGLKLPVLLLICYLAPILGDQCNYFIGHFFGKKIIESGKVKAMTPERIAKTEGMIEKWGPLAVFLGRFFPFIRTFMPFISGITGMRWIRFAPFSVLGGLTWASLFTLLGYFFGGIPAVQKHFELVIILILLVSLAPTVITAIRAGLKHRKNKAAGKAAVAGEENSADHTQIASTGKATDEVKIASVSKAAREIQGDEQNE